MHLYFKGIVQLPRKSLHWLNEAFTLRDKSFAPASEIRSPVSSGTHFLGASVQESKKQGTGFAQRATVKLCQVYVFLCRTGAIETPSRHCCQLRQVIKFSGLRYPLSLNICEPNQYAHEMGPWVITHTLPFARALPNPTRVEFFLFDIVNFSLVSTALH